jgi:hypothetical protein
MKTTTARITAIATLAIFLLSGMAILVPSAAAQAASSIIVSIKPDTNMPNGRLLPETGEARPKISAAVEVAAAGACAQSIVLTYTVKNKPPYASVILNPSTRTVIIKGQSDTPVTGSTPQTYTAPDVEMIITTTREAPAFQNGVYDVEVTGKAGVVTNPGTACYVADPSAGKGSATVLNDYLPLVVVNPGSLYVKAGQNKKVVFPIELQNLGNGPTRIKVEAIQSGKNKLDAINTGAEVRLETRAGKGASAQFKTSRNIEVQTPHSNGYANSIYAFNVKFGSQFDGTASGTLATDEQTVAFAVQVQGVYVPGFDPVMLIAALGIGLVALRRIHKND